MRIYAVSDLHIDYKLNARWVSELSAADYTEDVLILAGDVADSLQLLDWGLKSLAGKFKQVLFVPGNHDLWVYRDQEKHASLDKFKKVCAVAEQCGVSMQPYSGQDICIVPLLGWYDFSFGRPADELRDIWMDFQACDWPERFGVGDITDYFLELNRSSLDTRGKTVISFSHFLPRIDVMPSYIPQDKRILYPVLGTILLEKQIRRLQPAVHVYGHSHVNQQVEIEGIFYVNNAFGYPAERWTTKDLITIEESC